MEILLLTNEYPPHIYGGAGVHVEHLCRELRHLDGWHHRLSVFCFGDGDGAMDAPGVTPVPGPAASLPRHPKLMDALYRNLWMAESAHKADLIHCHTWYTYLAGCLLKQLLGARLLITVHSLEPHRPWKHEQLGNGYQATCWLEKTALLNADGIIAVSTAMKQDIMDLYGIEADRISVIYNGIDTRRFRRVVRPDILKAYGIDPDRPYVLFVGRVTHQKGILHLVRALPQLDHGVQAVLCAGAPDTPAIAAEMKSRVHEARRGSENPVIWIEEMVPTSDLAALYSHAAVFVCPSIYEPFGIINLEAMACGTPVVAAAVGGIPEVVVHGETGLLVPFEPEDGHSAEPRRPQQYARDLAQAINSLLSSEALRNRLGARARQRVEERFSWRRIAEQTRRCYEASSH
jgi:glycogen synthase